MWRSRWLLEQVEGPVIWNAMTAMLCHCNNYATKLDFGITNDYISNESVDVCSVISQGMLLNKQSSDWWVETSRRSCGVNVITTPFPYYRWLRLEWERADVSFAISKGILLNNSQVAECSETSWRSGCVTVIKHNFDITNDYVSN